MVRKLQLNLLAIVIETSYLYPLYYLILTELQTPSDSIVSLWLSLSTAIGLQFLNSFLATRKWRIITVWSINILLFIFIAHLLVRIFLKDVINIMQLLISFLFLFWIWLRSAIIAREETTYYNTVKRFEISIVAMLIILFSLEKLSFQFTNIIILLFILYCGNIISLFLTKIEVNKFNLFLGIGVISIPTLPLFLGLTFLKPYLESSSKMLYEAITPVVIFTRDIFLDILVFLLRLTNFVPQDNSSTPQQEIPEEQISKLLPDFNEESIFLKIIFWLLITVFVMTILVLLFFLLRQLLIKLLSIQDTAELKRNNFSLLKFIKKFVLKIKKYIFEKFLLLLFFIPCSSRADLAYEVLLNWGKRKKTPRKTSETPYEYSLRLSQKFPHHKDKFKLITDFFVEQKYGSKKITSQEILIIKSAVRKLYLPFISRHD